MIIKNVPSLNLHCLQIFPVLSVLDESPVVAQWVESWPADLAVQG